MFLDAGYLNLYYKKIDATRGSHFGRYGRDEIHRSLTEVEALPNVRHAHHSTHELHGGAFKKNPQFIHSINHPKVREGERGEGVGRPLHKDHAFSGLAEGGEGSNHTRLFTIAVPYIIPPMLETPALPSPTA